MKPQSCLFASLLLLLGTCSTPDGTGNNLQTSLSQLPPPNLTHGLIAFNTPPPLYPLRARSLNLEGWVMLSFSVDADGSVLANSIETVQAQPPGYFDNAAIAAARRMRFDNNRRETVQDVRWVFRFELEEENVRVVESPEEVIEFRELIPMRYITPDYPASAQAQNIEGHVTLSLTVSPQGSVENIRITESEPPGVFDASALNAANRLRFEPRIVFNEPVAVEDVPYRFDWQLEENN